MSIMLMTAAFKTKMPPTHKFVLVALCDNANDQGECFPSISMLVEKTSLTDRAIQNSIRYLEESGYLKRDMRAGRSTYYFISDPRTWFTPEADSPPKDVHPTPERGSPPPPKDVHPTPERGSPITIKEPSIEPSGNHKNKTPKFSALEVLLGLGVDEQTANDWLTHRKGKKAPVTQTVINQFHTEAEKAGVTLADAMKISCARNWQGFCHTWLQKDSQQPNTRASPGKPTVYERSMANAEKAKRMIFGETDERPAV